MSLPCYAKLASLIDARARCTKNNNQEWHNIHEDRIIAIVNRYFPSGGGWDLGTKIDLDNSTGEKLIFTGAYHHMNDSGMYDGWTDHTITVTPSLQHGFALKISGRDRNQIKEYIGDMFHASLSEHMADDVDTQPGAQSVTSPTNA